VKSQVFHIQAGKVKSSALTAAAAKALPYLLVLLAFSLRIYRIDYQSVWQDEGVSIHLAGLSIPAILADRASDVHPPLYFVLLHLWTELAGFTELSVRFFSLLFGVLLIPMVYFVARKIFGTRTALAAAAITTFSPLCVVYSQEARMYSMLPLVYLLLIYKLYRMAWGGGWRWRDWVKLTILELLGLYLHYFSIFAVIYVNLFVAALWLRKHEAIELRRWLFSQMLTVLLYMPWVWAVVECWTRANLLPHHLGGPSKVMNSLDLVSFIWCFFIGGKDLRGHPLFISFATLLAIAFAGALSFALKDDRRRRTMITLCHWIAPSSMLFIVWWWSPRVHPRYILMVAPPLFILMGHVISVLSQARRPSKLAAASLATALTATFTLGLMISYFDPRYFKDDVRGMVRYIERISNADDLLIVRPGDYSVPYYYRGDASIAMIKTYDEAQKLALLRESTHGKRRVFLIWPFGASLGRFPFLLEMHGRLTSRRLFRGYSLRVYELERDIFPPQVEPIWADFGDLHLTGAFYQDEVEADNAICVALRWRLARATKRAYKSTVILWDEEGHCLSSADVLLLNGWGFSTDHWARGEEAVSYYIVPVPLGTPPLTYRLTVGVYDAKTLKDLDLLDEAGNPAGRDFLLGEVKLTKAHDFQRDPYGTRKGLRLEAPEEPEVAEGLALEGFAIREMPARVLNVTLRWRALRDGLPRYVPRLRLRQGDALLAEVGSPLFEGRYPTSEWSRGEVVFEQRDLIYPPKPGRAVLELEVGRGITHLKGVELKGAELLFEPPPMQYPVRARFGEIAQLIGYDLSRTEVSSGGRVKLTLCWRALNEGPVKTSYKVFAHLLNGEGRLIGQHDGFPAEGTKPTTSWVEGEIIIDVHEMGFREPYRGKATIEVGMYDPQTGERLPAFDEEGKRLPNDRVLLDTVVTVK